MDQAKDARIARSLEMVARWNEPHFALTRAQARAALDRYNKAGAYSEQSITELANFLDELALTVLSDVADEDMLKRFFVTIVKHFTSELGNWLATQRTEVNDPHLFGDIERLRDRWR